MLFRSIDIEKGIAADSVVTTKPKNEVLNALDLIRRRLQCEGADVNTFSSLKRQLQESVQNNIKQTTIAQYFT